MARTHPETACYTQPILNPALAHNTAFKNNVTQNGIWPDGLSTSWFGRTASKSDTIRHVVSLLGYFRWNLETALFFFSLRAKVRAQRPTSPHRDFKSL